MIQNKLLLKALCSVVTCVFLGPMAVNAADDFDPKTEKPIFNMFEESPNAIPLDPRDPSRDTRNLYRDPNDNPKREPGPMILLEGADPMIAYDLNLGASAKVYAKGQDPKGPSISPVYADFNKGFPPSYISTGTRDLFLSHCARLQRKLIDAGIETKLVIHEGMWHVFQAFPIPEAKDAWRDMAAYLERHWAR